MDTVHENIVNTVKSYAEAATQIYYCACRLFDKKVEQSKAVKTLKEAFPGDPHIETVVANVWETKGRTVDGSTFARKESSLFRGKRRRKTRKAE